jgi:hypothetical protein
MVPHLINITPCLPLLSTASSIRLPHVFFLLVIHHYKIFSHQEITKEKMASRGPPPAKQRRREDDDESRCRRKLKKGKEPATKDTDEELFFNDTKFTVDMLRSTFRKFEDVGTTFNSKAHHEVDKDSRVKGLTIFWKSKSKGIKRSS